MAGAIWVRWVKYEQNNEYGVTKCKVFSEKMRFFCLLKVFLKIFYFFGFASFSSLFKRLSRGLYYHFSRGHFSASTLANPGTKAYGSGQETAPKRR